MRNSFLFIIMSLLFVILLSACNGSGSEKAASEAKKEIIFGFTPGPYSDQVKKGIEPYLKNKGYAVKYVEISDPNQPNFALAEGSIDVNVFQHTAFFKNFINENKLELTETIKVPTAPMGLYSDKHGSKDELKDGQKVAIPNDPANVARALRMLEQIGWLQLKKGYDPLTVSKNDIVDQKVKFSFVEVEQAQVPRILPDVDYAVANGYTILVSDRKLSSALYLEDPLFEYQNFVAVRTEDKDKQFVKEIIDAYQSPEFQKAIESNKEFEGFHRPDYFK
ncbi:MetQ/NlpA family ABC transporter substrate-binding protein [Peribacillus simplex]|uniref:MetQ/NlpA family ABC transporter substrate-binding protein n=1 Tax=Peribacillus simplex TaxID=1478 RepID=UPI0024C1E599|nr:MetQ/NlpA family ABC transporter substrate-binding protein [Peribacillus simplex]WHY96993.1 MetQ/NlpA family ABC transporter substrate-binding protein [Peribacillus simplex]